jgi:exonuclease III
MLTRAPGTLGSSETYAAEVRELTDRDLEASTLVAPVSRSFTHDLLERVAPEYPAGITDSARAVNNGKRSYAWWLSQAGKP